MNILVVRQHNQIGDMLCSLSLYKAIKKKYPNSHITLVAAKTNYDIPYFDINPYIDRVIVYDKSSLKAILNFFTQIRERKYDYGFVPSTIALSRTSHLVNFLSGASKRIGVNSINGVKNKSSYLLNLKSDFNWKGKHQQIRNLEIARIAGFDLFDEELKDIKFEFTQDEISIAKNHLSKLFIDNSKRIIAFHPGAGKKQNIWPTNYFFELILKLKAEFDISVLFTTGKIDKPIIDELSEKMHNSNVSFSLLENNVSIRQQSAILSLVSLYITNDTGSMHIAGFGRAKMISLFGPTDPKEWCPEYEKSYFIKSNSGKIEDISIEQVYQLAKKILKD